VRAVCLLLLAALSLSTIGEDVKPVWLSGLEEPGPVNFSALPIGPVPATRPTLKPGDPWPLVMGEEKPDPWLSFSSPKPWW